MVAAAWPPWDVPILAWVALVPWCAAIERQTTLRGALVQGFWLSFTVGLCAAYWLAQAAREFLQLSWPLSVLVLLVFAASCAQPHLLFVGPLIHWGSARLGPGATAVRSLIFCLAMGLLYTGLDWVAPRLFDVGVGYALHDATRLRQLADLGGVPLLTFLVVFVNLLVWRAWTSFREAGPRRITVAAHLLAVGTVLALGGGYGSLRLRASEAMVRDASSSFRAAVVQGNVANDVRLAWARGDERAAEKQLAAYMLPTEEEAHALPEPELIVWPEVTFPGVFLQPRSTLQQGRATKFDRQVLRLNRPMVFGAYDLESVASEPVLYNALFAVTPRYDRPGSQGAVQRYRKHHLLPFAETIPGLSDAAWFRRYVPSVGFFGRGEGPTTFTIETPSRNEVVLGPLICSESLSSQHVIETAKLGAQVLLNVGSDGWFGRWGEPQFHLAAAKFRSVETRRPQIRSANTGISALILPSGEVAARSEIGKTSVLSIDVPITAAEETLLMRWGSWFGAFSLLLGLVLFLFQLFVLRARRPAGETGV